MATQNNFGLQNFTVSAIMSLFILSIFFVFNLSYRYNNVTSQDYFLQIFLFVLVLVISGLGYLLSRWSSKTLASSNMLSFYGFEEIERVEVRGIVTKGPFRYIRHPWYAGWTLYVISTTILWYLAFSTLVFNLLTIITLSLIPFFLFSPLVFLAVSREEEFLMDNFGPIYSDYKNNVKYRLIPLIF